MREKIKTYGKAEYFLTGELKNVICPRSLVQFSLCTHYIKMDKTSWAYNNVKRIKIFKCVKDLGTPSSFTNSNFKFGGYEDKLNTYGT